MSEACFIDWITAEIELSTKSKQLDEAMKLLRKAAMHVRPTCSDLYDELNAWLEANKQQP